MVEDVGDSGVVLTDVGNHMWPLQAITGPLNNLHLFRLNDQLFIYYHQLFHSPDGANDGANDERLKRRSSFGLRKRFIALVLGYHDLGRTCRSIISTSIGLLA